MSLQAVLTAQVLPPLLFAWLALVGGLLAWPRRRLAGALALVGGLGLLALATPFAAGRLRASLEAAAAPDHGPAPSAIVILGADAVRTMTGMEVGPLTLERLRAGAALHRATGLPVLVTGGPVGPAHDPLARLMAASLAADFGIATRWLEPQAGDTRDNANLAAAILRADGVAAAHLVTHGWHMPRARAAFARAGLPVRAAPLRHHAPPAGAWQDFVPRADHLAVSWWMLREAAGRLVYRLRDGAA